jgi:hypothetical protein
LVIFLLGPVTGGVVNPARQFGPAVLADQGTDLWIYLTAPIVGSVLGAGLHRLLYRRFKTRQPLTYKLAGSRSPTNRAREMVCESERIAPRILRIRLSPGLPRPSTSRRTTGLWITRILRRIHSMSPATGLHPGRSGTG